MTMDDNKDSSGIARYPVGTCPILSSDGRSVLTDSLGRRSYTTSIAYGPSVGKNIMLGYLPREFAKEGQKLITEYFGEPYPITVEALGCKPLYDPLNQLPRS